MVIDMAEVEVPSLMSMSMSEEVWTWVLQEISVRQREQEWSAGTRDEHCGLEGGRAGGSAG